MRTNIEIEDELMAKAMAVTDLPTKKAVVAEALRRMVATEEARAEHVAAKKSLLKLWGAFPDWNDGRFDEGENPKDW